MIVRRSIAVLMAAFVLRVAAGTASGGTSLPPVPGARMARSVVPAERVVPPARAAPRNSVTPTQAAVAVGDSLLPAPAPAQPAKPAEACPGDMALVDGEYCTEVRQTCKRWLDDRKLPFARCGEYEKPARCVGQHIHMRFCIDRHEYTRPGEQLPANYQSFVTASRLCKKLGKRVCTESEWNFACEGEEMRPYPYGWARAAVCNQDQSDLYEPNPRRRVLRDLRKPANANPECKSPFGVFDMVGNLDEPVLREEARYATPFRNGLKGGWWMAGRNRCRPATTAHDDYYNDIQVGVRCCSDVPGDETGATG